jgi:hypothetical protein
MTARAPARVVKLTKPRLPAPPLPLGKVGMKLWADIVGAYKFADRASYECLFQAASAADRAEACRQQIAQDGVVIEAKGGGLREHPLVPHELQARSFVVRSLAKLGLDLEPIRSVGRPPGRAFS